MSSVAESEFIDIPGFQVQKELGRGGMARVYLAVQRKFGFDIVGESSAMCVARGAEVRHVDTALSRERYEELQS